MVKSPLPRAIISGGDPYGTHRVLEPAGAMPQPAQRLDNDFSRIFEGEILIGVDCLNIDAASLAQMVGPGRAQPVEAAEAATATLAVTRAVTDTVAARGKQHNPVTGSGGMLLGTVLQVAPGRAAPAPPVGARIATLVSLSLTPLRLSRIVAVRLDAAQLDVEGEAVLFGSSPFAVMPDDIAERVALAALDVAGAAPQVPRRVRPGSVVPILGAGGKSGVLCAAQARRSAGASGVVVGLEANDAAAADARALGLYDAVVVADARDAMAVRRGVLAGAGDREAEVTFSCVTSPDVELGAILATRDRGTVYFFAMSTSFTKAALGAEGAGRDVDLYIGNGYAAGHAEHTLDLLRTTPAVRALFEKRYG